MAKTNGQVKNFDLLAAGAGELAVAGVTTVYSETFACPKDVTFGFVYKFRSGGVVACDIFMEQGNTPPETEGAASANMVVPDNAVALAADVADTNLHVTAYAPRVTDFLRIKVVGKGANAATTVLEKFIVNTIVNA